MGNIKELLNDPVTDHLPVNSLAQKVLDRFSVVSISDLCSLDISQVANEKGIGKKKIDTLSDLVDQARQLTQSNPSKVAERQTPPIETGVSGDSQLLYIPGLLKAGFGLLNINTVEELLRLERGDLQALPPWGEIRVSAAIGLSTLYKRALSGDSIDSESILSAIVPETVLPDRSLAKIPISDFLRGSGQSTLKGRAAQEANDLRTLLGQRFRELGELGSVANLDWHDVPLQVNRRVRDFLDKYSLRLVCELDQLAE